MRVALFDWELTGEDHRDRLERLFGGDMPQILYARCEPPLVYEKDRLKADRRRLCIQYAVYGSVAFAADGPPEAAEVASRYLSSVRQIGCGSLHIAHISKAESADQKPFGSIFWHNGSRSTWDARAVRGSNDDSVLRLGLLHCKTNLSRRVLQGLAAPIATECAPEQPAAVPEASQGAEVTTPFDEIAPPTDPIAQEYQAAIESASDHVETSATPEVATELATAGAQEPNVAPRKAKATKPPVRLARLVKLAFDQIRQASTTTPAVLIRQLDAIGRLAPRLGRAVPADAV